MVRRFMLLAGVVAATGITVWSSTGSTAADFAPATSGPDRLITNEYVHWNPRAGDGRSAKDWDVTSGSLFVRAHVGWSGLPDAATPDATSSTGTGSSVFRMNSFRSDFDDVRITLQIRNLRMITLGGRAPAAATDGIHVFLRRQDENELYVASINRRDDLIVVKKKLRGGKSNGGTYYTLGEVPYRPIPGAWQPFSIEIKSTGSALVTITVTQGEHHLLEAVDDGRHGRVILQPGSIGLRADNCEFEFKNFRAHHLTQ